MVPKLFQNDCILNVCWIAFRSAHGGGKAEGQRIIVYEFIRIHFGSRSVRISCRQTHPAVAILGSKNSSLRTSQADPKLVLEWVPTALPEEVGKETRILDRCRVDLHDFYWFSRCLLMSSATLSKAFLQSGSSKQQPQTFSESISQNRVQQFAIWDPFPPHKKIRSETIKQIEPRAFQKRTPKNNVKHFE